MQPYGLTEHCALCQGTDANIRQAVSTFVCGMHVYECYVTSERFDMDEDVYCSWVVYT